MLKQQLLVSVLMSMGLIAFSVTSASAATTTAPSATLCQVEEEIPASAIKTTTSSQFSDQQSVRHLVDRSGMTDLTHDNNAGASTMWHTVENPAATSAADGLSASPAWVRFDFDVPRVIGTISIWNHNQDGFTERGFQRTHILGTVDGVHWIALAANGDELVTIPRASGETRSFSNLSITTGNLAIKAVVIAADPKEGNYGGTVYGLSAVKFVSTREVAEKDLPVPSGVECEVHPFYLHRYDGQPGRAVTVHLNGGNLYIKAALDYSDASGNRETTTVAANSHGASSIKIQLPAGAGLTKPVEAEISLHFGATTLHQTVTIPVQRQWTVFIYPHSHVDIGYTSSQEIVKRIHERNVDVGIDLGRKTAGYPLGARHVWNTEAQWVVESYLHDSTPEKKAAFIDAVKKGWICVDANYDNGDTSAFSDEEFLRFFRNGMEMRGLTGKPVDTMVQFDVPAMSWGVVQAAAQCGVRGILSFPNGSARQGTVSHAWEEKPFWWVAPDGRSRVLFVQPEAYALGYKLKGRYVKHAPFQSPDDQYPDSLIGRIPSPTQEYRKDIDRLTTADPTAHFIDPYIFQATARLERQNSPCDIYTISWSTADNSLVDADLPDAVKSWNEKYAYPKLIIAGAHEILEAYEKKFGSTFPEVRGDYTEYWTDGIGTDARRSGMNRRAKERLVQGETLWSMLNRGVPAPTEAFHDSWRFVLLGSEHTWGYYNPSAPYAKGVEATKASYFESADKTSSDLLAYTLKPVAKPGSDTVAVLNTLSWTRAGLVTLDSSQNNRTGAVLDDQGKHVMSQRLSTGEFVFRADDVPALGSRLYHLQAGDTANPPQSICRASDNTLENDLVKIVINPETGDIANLIDKRSGHEFVDPKSPYALNSYRYLHGGDSAEKATGPTNVVIRIKETGPLVASLEVESKAEGCNKLIREVRIAAGQSSVDMTDTLDKISTRAKEGVHFGFAFNVPGGTTHIDIPSGVMRPEADQIPGSNHNWLAFQRWIDISNADAGVTWTAIEAPLVEFGDLTANVLGGANGAKYWRQHTPETQTLFSWALNNHWFTNFPLEQGGIITFHYQILPHGAYDAVAANRFGLEQNRPLVQVPVDKNPVDKALVEIDNPRVAISALKPSENNKAVILRLRSVSDQPEMVNLTWPAGEPRSVHFCLADEQPGDPARGALLVSPYGVIGLRVEFQ